MRVVFRQFAPDDYPLARALWECTPGVGLSAADEAAPVQAYLARNPGMSFVATHEGKTIGTILCGHDGRRGLIHHLAVSQLHRRQGIASELLRLGLAVLRQAGIQKVHIMVFESNEPGRLFWRQVQAVERTELALYSLATEQNAG